MICKSINNNMLTNASNKTMIMLIVVIMGTTKYLDKTCEVKVFNIDGHGHDQDHINSLVLKNYLKQFFLSFFFIESERDKF